jgi:hypothetical protein
MNKKTIITNSRAWLAYPLPFLLALVAMTGRGKYTLKTSKSIHF